MRLLGHGTDSSDYKQHFKYSGNISLIATLQKPLINFGRKIIDRVVHATTIQKLKTNDAGAACRTKPF